jgi:hypothetical protein
MSQIFSPEYRLCLVPNADNEKTRILKEKIAAAVLEWLTPLSAIAAQPVNTRVQFL